MNDRGDVQWAHHHHAQSMSRSQARQYYVVQVYGTTGKKNVAMAAVVVGFMGTNFATSIVKTPGEHVQGSAKEWFLGCENPAA